MNVTIEKLKFLLHGNEYSFLTISPHSQTKTSWSAQSPTFSRVITSWNEKSIWPYSHPNVVLRGLITLNIHYRDHGQTINILVEMLKKKNVFFKSHDPRVYCLSVRILSRCWPYILPPSPCLCTSKMNLYRHSPCPGSSHAVNSGKGIPTQCSKSQHPNFN